MSKSQDRDLLFSVSKKDFKIDWFSGTGAGGQGRNKLMMCCRLAHKESGATATGQSSKSRVANQKEAFKGIQNHPKFKMWYNQKLNEALTKESIDDKVQKAIQPENLRIENKVDGKWNTYQENTK